MSIQELLKRPVLTLPPTATCTDAARLMREANVGSVVVAEGREPLGVITDRDLALRVIAEARDPEALRLKDVMTPHPIFLSVRRSLDDAISAMRDLGVRRLPIVDEHGHLEGIVSMDDILALLAREMGQLAEAVRRDVGSPASAR